MTGPPVRTVTAPQSSWRRALALDSLTGISSDLGLVFMDRIIAAALIGAAALLCSCGQHKAPPAPSAASTLTAPKVETPTSSNGSELLEAFRVAFGGPAPYLAKVPSNDADVSWSSELTFSPAAFIDIAPNMVALVSNGEGQECHACTGMMVMHYLKRTPQGFVVLGRWPIPAGGAAYGAVAPWTVRADIDDVPTMLISNSDSGMGCDTTTDTIVALTPTRPEARGSFLLSSSYEDGSDAPDKTKEFKYHGTIVPIRRGESFMISYSGTKHVDRNYTKGPDGTYTDAGVEPLDRQRALPFPPGC
jgi:hypothetical protein